jgi:5,10-methylenetetrahydrofolate reductase
MSPRDMNKLALESRLLGAQLLGLDNIVVIQGDRFTERDRSKTVNDYTATELIAAIGRLNDGIDHRESKLRARTHFCIGATIDPDRPPAMESVLTRRKVEAGAHYFITQAGYDLEKIERFLEACGDVGDAPIFWGLQVLAKDGFQFGAVPPKIQAELDKGRDAVEIALDNYTMLRRAGATGIYLMPPILVGGARDYAAAQRFLEEVRAGE